VNPPLRFWMSRPAKALWAARTALDRAYESALAHRAPKLYAWRIRRRRGAAVQPEESARYARAVADDYEAIALAAGVITSRGDLWRGRRVLELGPGDLRSVGLIARARGADRYIAVDAYDIESRDEEKNREVYERVAEREGLPRDQWRELLAGTTVRANFADVASDGRRVDLVISRAVLEHVRDLPGLFASLAPVLADDAVLIHKVDLRSHGMHRDNVLDFLLFPEAVYQQMASHLDLPNRVRAPAYLTLGARDGLRVVHASVSHRTSLDTVRALRPHLPPAFAQLPEEELRVLGLWLVQVGPRHPASAPALDAGALADAPTDGVSAF
jgi:SAM-dependent methyltransferase